MIRGLSQNAVYKEGVRDSPFAVRTGKREQPGGTVQSPAFIPHCLPR